MMMRIKAFTNSFLTPGTSGSQIGNHTAAIASDADSVTRGDAFGSDTIVNGGSRLFLLSGESLIKGGRNGGSGKTADSCAHKYEVPMIASGENGIKHAIKYCPGCNRVMLHSKEAKRAKKKGRDPFSHGLFKSSSKNYSDKEAIAEGDLRWITVHPHGEEDKGQPVLVHDNGHSYTVVGGAGGRLNHMVLNRTAKTDDEKAEKIRRRRELKQERDLKRLEDAGVSKDRLNEVQELKKEISKEVGTHMKGVKEKIIEKMADDNPELAAKIENGQGDTMLEKYIDSVGKEVEQKARETPGASEEAIEVAVHQAKKEAAQEVRNATNTFIEKALERGALKKMGEAALEGDANTVKTVIGGREYESNLSEGDIDKFVEEFGRIESLKKAQKTINKVLNGGDIRAISGIHAMVTPLSDEEARGLGLDKYMEDKSNNESIATHSKLVRDTDLAPPGARVNHQTAGASDSINYIAHNIIGESVVNPGLVKHLGVQGAARVAAAYIRQKLKAKGKKVNQESLKASEEIRDRMEQHGTAVAAGAIEKCKEMEDFGRMVMQAADSGDGTISKAEAHSINMRLAADRYRVLSIARGQLTGAQALAHYLSAPASLHDRSAMKLSGIKNEFAAKNLMKDLGLTDEDAEIVPPLNSYGSGDYAIDVKPHAVPKLAAPQPIGMSERAAQINEIEQDVAQNPGAFRPKYLPDNINLFPNQEVAVRAIEKTKRMLLAYSMGAGKTGIIWSTVGDLIGDNKIDRAIVVMPKSVKAAQGGAKRKSGEGGTIQSGEIHKYLKPEIASQIAVVNTMKELDTALGRIKAGDLKGIVISRDMLREKLPELKAAGFGGERSAFFADEAHEMATGEGKEASGRASAMKALAGSEYYVLATGTPISNNASELWSLYDMVHPGELGSQSEFTRQWQRVASSGGGLYQNEAMNALKSKLSSGMLFFQSVPTRENESGDKVPVNLETNVRMVEPSEESKSRIRDVNKEFERRIFSSDPAKRAGAGLFRHSKVMSILASDPNKINAINEIMNEEKSRDPRAKVGVYSFEREPLERANEALKNGALKGEGHDMEWLTGDESGAARRAVMEKINNRDSGSPGVMMSHAAIAGVNLQGLDHIVEMHPMPVAAAQLQLQKRHHRTGQTRDVRATTLVANHPSEMLQHFNVRENKMPALDLLAVMGDQSGKSRHLAKFKKEIQDAADGKQVPMPQSDTQPQAQADAQADAQTKPRSKSRSKSQSKSRAKSSDKNATETVAKSFEKPHAGYLILAKPLSADFIGVRLMRPLN